MAADLAYVCESGKSKRTEFRSTPLNGVPRINRIERIGEKLAITIESLCGYCALQACLTYTIIMSYKDKERDYALYKASKESSTART
jgi:hypothetical protein